MVVGTAQNAAGQPRAFLWRNGEMTDLNTLIPAGTGWVLESAAGVSEGGQIVGYGTLSGKRRAFLLYAADRIRAFPFGTKASSDSNLPHDGIEVGKLVEWTTSWSVRAPASLGRSRCPDDAHADRAGRFRRCEHPSRGHVQCDADDDHAGLPPFHSDSRGAK